jgi:hypothetical protein
MRSRMHTPHRKAFQVFPETKSVPLTLKPLRAAGDIIQQSNRSVMYNIYERRIVRVKKNLKLRNLTKFLLPSSPGNEPWPV